MGMAAFFISLSPKDLARLQDDPDAIGEFLDDEGEGERLSTDVDKAWHGIHYLLTDGQDDSSSPAAQAVLGGREVGDDMGYGPARVLEPEDVKDIAHALAMLPREVLSTRYRPREMDKAEIYPQIWERDGHEGLSYILQYYEVLRSFYRDVAQRSEGALLWLG